MRALIVDDEAPARRRLRQILREIPQITDVVERATGTEGLEAIRHWDPDVVFLDIEMPDLDGLALAARVRSPQTPALVFVTAYEQYAVGAFEVQALYYLLKPLDESRVAEAVRRAATFLQLTRQEPERAVDRFGSVIVEHHSHRVLRDGRPVDLRPKEFELLVALLKGGGAIASREQLLRDVWGYQSGVTSRTVDTHIAAIRKLLESDPARPTHILTVRNYGYRLDRDGVVEQRVRVS